MGAENAETGALLNSPLHQRHVAAGAKFAPFSGWSMPLEYSGAGVLAEHAAALPPGSSTSVISARRPSPVQARRTSPTDV